MGRGGPPTRAGRRCSCDWAGHAPAPYPYHTSSFSNLPSPPHPPPPTPPHHNQVDPGNRSVHVSFIVGTGGPFTPAPSFFVLASDKPDEPLCARSMTTVWEAVIERVRQARAGAFSGTTAVSGPPYFGLANPGVGWHFGLGVGGRGGRKVCQCSPQDLQGAHRRIHHHHLQAFVPQLRPPTLTTSTPTTGMPACSGAADGQSGCRIREFTTTMARVALEASHRQK